VVAVSLPQNPKTPKPLAEMRELKMLREQIINTFKVQRQLLYSY